MAYVYNEVNWEDLPSTNTPRNATNLGNMDTGIKENNNMLNGIKSMGSIVVDDINCKNMFNPSSVIVNAGVNNGVIFSTNDYDIYVVKVVPTKKYTISKTSYNAGLIGYYSTFPAIGNTITNIQTLRDVTTLTTTAQDNYLCIMIAKADNKDTIQVELGETVTAHTPHKNFDGEIYSENEIVIGKWSNGKDLYRKEFMISNPASANTNYVNVSGLNIEDVLLKGYYKTTSGNKFDIPFYDSESNYAVMFVSDAGYIRGRFGNPSIISECKVILDYTKTTSGNRSITPEEEETR